MVVVMVLFLFENGVDGDDEREEEEEDEEEEEEEENGEEEGEEELCFKYQCMGGNVFFLLFNDVVFCIVVVVRMIVFGIYDGMVYIFDFFGNQVSFFFNLRFNVLVDNELYQV